MSKTNVLIVGKLFLYERALKSFLFKFLRHFKENSVQGERVRTRISVSMNECNLKMKK